MSLPSRPLLETKRATTPGEFARLLRGQGNVFRWEPDRFWVVTEHALATHVLKGEDYSADRSAFFRSRVSGCPFHKVKDFFGVVGRMMVTSDPPEHTARRKLAAFGLADSILDEFRPAVERTVDGLLAGVRGKRTVEFVREIALPLPCAVLADLFCVPTERRGDFYRWSNDMTQFFGGGSEAAESDAVRANGGAASLRAYFAELIQQRRREPREDFLSRLLGNQRGMGLDDEEVISQAAMMLVAGTVTTTDQICNNMHTLLMEESAPARLRAEPSLLEAALEEATRLDPAVNFVFRLVRKDTRLGAAALKSGELVFVSNHAVNRDPAVFEAPEACRLDRARNPHLSYGSGIHYCLGARLGRIQMRALFERLLGGYPGLSLAPGRRPERKHQSLAFSGFESLVLSLEGAP